MPPHEYDERPHEALCAYTGITLERFPGPFRERGGSRAKRGPALLPSVRGRLNGYDISYFEAPSSAPNLNGQAQRILDSEDPTPKQIWLVQAAPLTLRDWQAGNIIEHHRGHPQHLLESITCPLHVFKFHFASEGCARAKWARPATLFPRSIKPVALDAVGGHPPIRQISSV